jgi:hypothetical protein
MKLLKRILTMEEHFILKDISKKVGAFNFKQYGGIMPNNAGSRKNAAAVGI